MQPSAVRTLALGGYLAAGLASCGFDWSLPEPLPAQGGGGGGGGASTVASSTSSTAAVTTIASSGAGNQSCTDCATSALTRACLQPWDVCNQTNGCVAIANCAISCGGSQACVTQCEGNATNAAIAAFTAVAQCVCTVCQAPCGQNGASCQ